MLVSIKALPSPAAQAGAFAFALQIRQTTAAILLPMFGTGHRFSKSLLMPFPTLRPPLFCLISSEAVLLTGKGITKLSGIKKSAGLTEKRASGGGNDGLAFAMCEARKRRKNRQGGLKLFSVLSYSPIVLFFNGVHEVATLSLVTFHQGKVTAQRQLSGTNVYVYLIYQ